MSKIFVNIKVSQEHILYLLKNEKNKLNNNENQSLKRGTMKYSDFYYCLDNFEAENRQGYTVTIVRKDTFDLSFDLLDDLDEDEIFLLENIFDETILTGNTYWMDGSADQIRKTLNDLGFKENNSIKEELPL